MNQVHQTDEKRKDISGHADKDVLFSGFNQGAWAFCRSLAFRWVVFAVFWWGLSSGVMREMPLALLIITASAVLSCMLVPRQQISLAGIVKFIPFFVRMSIMGGVDVAKRAFVPAMPLKTGIIDYRLQLTHPFARVLLVWIVSLLPGTAGVKLHEQTLKVHVLDQDLPHQDRLSDLEKRIASLFWI